MKRAVNIAWRVVIPSVDPGGTVVNYNVEAKPLEITSGEYGASHIPPLVIFRLKREREKELECGGIIAHIK